MPTSAIIVSSVYLEPIDCPATDPIRQDGRKGSPFQDWSRALSANLHRCSKLFEVEETAIPFSVEADFSAYFGATHIVKHRSVTTDFSRSEVAFSYFLSYVTRYLRATSHHPYHSLQPFSGKNFHQRIRDHLQRSVRRCSI